ncbi:MAG: hypothetical protein J7521_20185 [Caulobacter sp.]|nr:hypothetical protein [Caulobacter sp.]
MTCSTAAMVRRIVANRLKVDPADVGPGLTFAQVGVCDLTMIEVLMEVEDHLDAEISAWPAICRRQRDRRGDHHGSRLPLHRPGSNPWRPEGLG